MRDGLPPPQHLPKHMNMKPLVLIGLLACGTCASAAGKILLETPVNYRAGAGVIDRVKEECQIGDLLVRRVGAVLQNLNNSADNTIAAGAAADGNTVLRLQITNAMGAGGGSWSGPKSLSVSAELLENGKVLRQTHINRWTNGGVFGGFKGTCSMFDRAAGAIGKDLGRWVRDPAYKVAEEPAPKQKDGETAPSTAASAAAM